MNMADILQQWENTQKIQKPKKNEQEEWLNKYGTIDKDSIAQKVENTQKSLDKKFLVDMKPQAVLDLHGLTQEQAQKQLDYFITDCTRKKLKKVVIIHGKGNHSASCQPVLGRLVQRFIQNDKRCGTSGHAKTNAEGGSGATWIILKY